MIQQRDMKAALRWHKISAWVLILMGAVHLAGTIYSFVTPPDTPEEVQVRKAMQAFVVPDPVFGPRSMMRLFDGFSLTFGAMAILWGALCLAAVRGGGSLEFVRRMMRLNTLMCAVLMALCIGFFITPPATFVAVALICAIGAQVKLPGN